MAWNLVYQFKLKEMIDQEHLPEYVENAIPEMTEIIESSGCQSAYDILSQMVKYTANQILTNNLNAAKKCFSLAEQLYTAGNYVIRNAVENVFVYSFSHALFHDESKRKTMLELVPGSLYDLYKKQVINSHL